jgi:hypothetical protein
MRKFRASSGVQQPAIKSSAVREALLAMASLSAKFEAAEARVRELAPRCDPHVDPPSGVIYSGAEKVRARLEYPGAKAASDKA